jgi:hypothetical protein
VNKWLLRFIRTRIGRALFPLAACVDDAVNWAATRSMKENTTK